MGVITLDSALFGPAATLRGGQRAALDAHYSVTVANLRHTDRGAVRDAMSHLVQHGVDGVIVLAPLLSGAQALAERPVGMPAVAIGGETGHGIDAVTIDQRAGAKAATTYLLDLGHPTVWHVAGPSEWVDAHHRTAGWRAALECAGAEVSPPLLGDWSVESGFEAGRVLARISEVSAIFVANDAMAIGVLRALHEHGRRVPDDVSLIGWDDVPEAAYLNPPLTTVHQDFAELGRRGFELLIDRIEAGAGPTRRDVVQPTLVVRNTTASMLTKIGTATNLSASMRA